MKNISFLLGISDITLTSLSEKTVYIWVNCKKIDVNISKKM